MLHAQELQGAGTCTCLMFTFVLKLHALHGSHVHICMDTSKHQHVQESHGQ